jgi:hypothetical protein
MLLIKETFLLLYYLKNTATLNKAHYAGHLQGHGKMWVNMEYKAYLRFEVFTLVKIHIVFYLVMMCCFCANPRFWKKLSPTLKMWAVCYSEFPVLT